MMCFDDVPLPRVRQALFEGNRDKPLTLNWKPIEPDAFDFLGLQLLNPGAEKAKRQIISEAVAAGDHYISYSRRVSFYSRRHRYFPPDTFAYRAIVPAVDQLSAAGILIHEKVPPGHRGFRSRFRASPALLAETAKVEIAYAPLEAIILRDEDGRRLPRQPRDARHAPAVAYAQRGAAPSGDRARWLPGPRG